MQRTCDGTDPNLINAFDQPGCRCGLVFDDVERMVVFPHARIPTHAEKAATLDDLLAAHADCGDGCTTARIARLIESLSNRALLGPAGHGRPPR